jgi:hypothetical protein
VTSRSLPLRRCLGRSGRAYLLPPPPCAHGLLRKCPKPTPTLAHIAPAEKKPQSLHHFGVFCRRAQPSPLYFRRMVKLRTPVKLAHSHLGPSYTFRRVSASSISRQDALIFCHAKRRMSQYDKLLRRESGWRQ